MYMVQAGTPVFTIIERDDAQLVRLNDSGPFWIEKKVSKRRVKAPEPEKTFIPLRHRPMPPDMLAVERAFIEGQIKLPRRRRDIRGGELVFIRKSYREHPNEQHPWRYLGQVYDGENRYALLIDGTLRPERGLGPLWNQQTTVLLERDDKTLEPKQVLIPIFPLPDGTKDPGWTDS